MCGHGDELGGLLASHNYTLKSFFYAYLKHPQKKPLGYQVPSELPLKARTGKPTASAIKTA